MSSSENVFSEVTEFLNQHHRYAVVTHLTPDGDALGSSYALCAFLRRTGRNAIAVLLEEPPAKYTFEAFRPYYILLDDVTPSVFDAAVAVDCATFGRLSKAGELFAGLPSLSIDHHLSNELYADVNFVRESPATSQVIYELFEADGVPLDDVARMGVYMGIIADTGNLTYSSTQPRTFEICAHLAASGLDTSAVAEKVFNTRTLAGTKLLRLFLRHMSLYSEDRIAVSYLTYQDVQSTGATVADAEGLINFARDIDTVEVAVCLREIARNKYKVSLRSKHQVDVSIFAQQFGGGGHTRAAGCVLEGKRADLEQQLVHGLEQLLA